MSNKIPKPIECPNCGSSNTCYNVPDWEDGYCNDPGFFECFNCGYNTGPHQTEEGIMAVIKSYPAPWTTETPTEDTAWPIRDSILKLIEAANILLNDCNYDGDGYEQIVCARDAALNYVEKGPLRPEE